MAMQVICGEDPKTRQVDVIGSPIGGTHEDADLQVLIEAGLSTLRACQLASNSRATCRYQSHAPDDAAIVAQIQEVAYRYPRYGYRRITALLR